MTVIQRPSFFQRVLLPGFAFKAVVIGGGYATGRELVEFFLPSGPIGGVIGMIMAMIIWSVVCSLTFLFAQATRSLDYKTFFRHLLGPLSFLFEISYLPFVLLILSVFGAAAGAIGAAVLGWPVLAGTLCFVAGIALVTTFGNDGVERLFKYVSIFLYLVYAAFLTLSLFKFGNRIAIGFQRSEAPHDWFSAGLTYASYNLVGATAILPVVRHLQTRKDAIVAGVLCGPLAMAPAILFFVCMCAFSQTIGGEALPSNYLLLQMKLPIFQLLFQVMIFAALLESGTGAVHAVNQRIAHFYELKTGRTIPGAARTLLSLALLILSIFIAARYGLVTLIAKGYRGLAVMFLVVYILPLLTYGVWRLWFEKSKSPAMTAIQEIL